MTVNGADSRRGQAVLLLEDDEVVTELLTCLLNSAGYDVFTASESSEGLKLFQTLSGRLSCVIMDYDLPGMHPTRLMEQLQLSDPVVPVILSSGYPKAFVERDFPIDRVRAFIQKPFPPSTLLSFLSNLS